MLHQKRTFPGISKDLNDDLSEIQIVLKKMKKRHFLLCLLLLQRNSDLPSISIGFLSMPSSTADLHITCETFTLTYLSIGKSKYKALARYRVITERFPKRANMV